MLSLHRIVERTRCTISRNRFLQSNDQWGLNSDISLYKLIIIIICNSYIAPNPTRLAQSTSQFKTRMDMSMNQYMKHAYTRRSNVNSKAQANMHTSRNHQCDPDMQCSSTRTMETSHDCKSNTESIKNWVLLEGLREQAGFQL